MAALGINWFIEGSVDFEHKKYILLDYLQEINRHFDKSRLYPNFNDLVFHYNNLKDFKNYKLAIQQTFPQRLTSADLAAVKLTYEKIAADDHLMMEIESIIHYALRKMNPALQTGRNIYDFVESQLNIDPVGLVPLSAQYGYFSLQNGSESTRYIYEYQLSIFENNHDNFRGINVQFVDAYEQSVAATPESVKLNLIRQRKHLPKPSFFTGMHHIRCLRQIFFSSVPFTS